MVVNSNFIKAKTAKLDAGDGVGLLGKMKVLSATILQRVLLEMGLKRSNLYGENYVIHVCPLAIKDGLLELPPFSAFSSMMLDDFTFTIETY